MKHLILNSFSIGVNVFFNLCNIKLSGVDTDKCSVMRISRRGHNLIIRNVRSPSSYPKFSKSTVALLPVTLKNPNALEKSPERYASETKGGIKQRGGRRTRGEHPRIAVITFFFF